MNGTPGSVGPPGAMFFLGTAARDASLGFPSGSPQKNPGALRDGLSSREQSSASLRSSASSALKLFSASLHLAVKAVHSCSTLFPNAKRPIRADPLNPSNPRSKLLMPTSRALPKRPRNGNRSIAAFTQWHRR